MKFLKIIIKIFYQLYLSSLSLSFQVLFFNVFRIWFIWIKSNPNFFKLGYFTFNKNLVDNLVYYGSYIVFGYFILFAIEHLMDYFRKQLPNNPYFNGSLYHLISYVVTTILFYFIIHIHYVYIEIDFWVISVIIGLLYIFKIIFYPDSENLNNKK